MENFKVGDWIVTNEVGVAPPEYPHEPPGGEAFKPNTRFQINRISVNDKTGLRVYWVRDGGGIWEGNFTHEKQWYLRKYKELSQSLVKPMIPKGSGAKSSSLRDSLLHYSKCHGN